MARAEQRFVSAGRPFIFTRETLCTSLEGRPVDVLTYHYYPEDEEPWAFVKARTLTWDDERGGWPSVGQDLWDPQEFYAGT